MDKKDLWMFENWRSVLPSGIRTGLRLRFEQSVDDEVRGACLRFAAWLRKRYVFPVRVPVYIKASDRIQAMDGDFVVGSFFEPDCYDQEPYIRLAAGDYAELSENRGRDDALASILSSFAHELTHYYQWINASSLSDAGRERQASAYARRILNEYAETCDHP